MILAALILSLGGGWIASMLIALALSLSFLVFGGVTTSPLGAAIPVEGMLLQVTNGSSPATAFTVANISEFTLPLGAKTVDVTNVGNQWEAMIPTLKTYGKISLKIFWVMEETTHRNNAGGGAVSTGLRYLYLAYPPILREWQWVYPDGNNSTDAFLAYVTGFSITGKVAGVFEATIELTANDQNPSFV
jgi:hypothetical protein